MIEIRHNEPLWNYTTLHAGGPAELFAIARTVDELAAFSIDAQEQQQSPFLLGWGSNILPSDLGLRGLVLLNLSTRIEILDEGVVIADSGAAFQDLFLKTAQAGLAGLEYAVGIPGTLGGALVSNAGAYRSNISEFLTEIEIVEHAERKWVSPGWMQFEYRDSILRKADPPACTLLRAKFRLQSGQPKAMFDEAREYQRQRIGKQPPQSSAGSFFKNVVDRNLAQKIEGLTPGMRENGVIPSGFLIERVGLKGARLGGAMLSARHANFMLNVGMATATEIRSLAEAARDRVQDHFGVTLEEECLYCGDWSNYQRIPLRSN